MHYMVNIDRQVEAAAKLVRQGDYFCINRGRQYGKTTTLAALKKKLETEGYAVFSISFEGMSDKAYNSFEVLLNESVGLMLECIEWDDVTALSESSKTILNSLYSADGKISTLDYRKAVSLIAKEDKVVILIDEVDQAGNYPEFLKYLGLLRDMFLKRDTRPTFQSVILAGVYDVKNLKLKIRNESDHQYNSPWNIAVPFDEDMSLPADGIAGMLAEYKTEHNVDFDNASVAQMIYDYTSGYPFLVSRLCQIIDSEEWSWDKGGVLKAVNAILFERNTLFDSMIKKLDEYPELKSMLKRILLSGVRETYNSDEKFIQIASMFNYITCVGGQVAIACRIMETRLYNYFLAEQRTSTAYLEGQANREEFIQKGVINIPHLLERFCVHVNQTFDMDKDHKFLEENGRQIFLTYLRPIINGIGNYYIEAQTRNNDRMDVVIDYLGKQYVIELKIWRGNAYNERGEEQLCRYLEYFDLQTGYLLSFCFNKTKRPGLLPAIDLKGRTLIEAIV